MRYLRLDVAQKLIRECFSRNVRGGFPGNVHGGLLGNVRGGVSGNLFRRVRRNKTRGEKMASGAILTPQHWKSGMNSPKYQCRCQCQCHPCRGHRVPTGGEGLGGRSAHQLLRWFIPEAISKICELQKWISFWPIVFPCFFPPKKPPNIHPNTPQIPLRTPPATPQTRVERVLTPLKRINHIVWEICLACFLIAFLSVFFLKAR